MSALRDRVDVWVSATLANRAVVEMLPETTNWTGRIKGLTSIGVIGNGQGQVDHLLREKLVQYAEKVIAAGKTLPEWEKPIPEVRPEAYALVRISTLRQQLKARASQWGVERDCLPVGAVERCLADIDAIVTTHAMQMQGVRKTSAATPETENPTPDHPSGAGLPEGAN